MDTHKAGPDLGILIKVKYVKETFGVKLIHQAVFFLVQEVHKKVTKINMEEMLGMQFIHQAIFSTLGKLHKWSQIWTAKQMFGMKQI